MLEKLYDLASSMYGKAIDHFWAKQFKGLRQSIRHTLMSIDIPESLERREWWTILDMGTGTGLAVDVLHEMFPEKKLRVLGVDISPKMLSAAARRFQNTSQVDFFPLQADIQEEDTWRLIDKWLQESDEGTLDWVLSFYVLHWLTDEDAQLVVERAVERTRSGGLVVGSVMGAQELYEVWGNLKEICSVWMTSYALSNLFQAWNPKPTGFFVSIHHPRRKACQEMSYLLRADLSPEELSAILRYQYPFWQVQRSVPPDRILDMLASQKRTVTRHFLSFAFHVDEA